MLTCPVSWAVRDPLSRVARSPHHGWYPAKIVLSTAVPLVAVSMALRSPINPRVGIMYFSLQHQHGTVSDSGRAWKSAKQISMSQQAAVQERAQHYGHSSLHSQSLCLLHSSHIHIPCCTLSTLYSRSRPCMLYNTILLGVPPQQS